MGLIYSLIVHEMMSCSLVLLLMNFFKLPPFECNRNLFDHFFNPFISEPWKIMYFYKSIFFIGSYCSSIVVSFTLNSIMCPIIIASCGQYCHNPSLGLTIKARAYKGVVQEWSLGVTFHAPKSVGKCEGMNPHTPKWSPTLGVEILMDSKTFKRWLQGSNSLDWRVTYIIKKILERKCLKWARMTHLGT